MSAAVPPICASCRAGRHQHDRFTATGADAGCPNLATPGDLSSGCQCTAVVHPVPPSRCPTCGRRRCLMTRPAARERHDKTPDPARKDER